MQWYTEIPALLSLVNIPILKNFIYYTNNEIYTISTMVLKTAEWNKISHFRPNSASLYRPTSRQVIRNILFKA